MKDLAETIRRQGLLQPATVRHVDGRYQLISGHARRPALRYLRDTVATTDAERERFARIRCLLLSGIDDARAATLTAIENLQRDDGTPLEQALMVARGRVVTHRRGLPAAPPIKALARAGQGYVLSDEGLRPVVYGALPPVSADYPLVGNDQAAARGLRLYETFVAG